MTRPKKHTNKTKKKTKQCPHFFEKTDHLLLDAVKKAVLGKENETEGRKKKSKKSNFHKSIDNV